MTAAGARFPRIHLIESILEPNRTIVTGFENLAVELKDGTVSVGVRVGETRDRLIIGDLLGQHEVRKDAIKTTRPLPLSLMPEGLEKTLTEKEFVDLVDFLVEQK